MDFNIKIITIRSASHTQQTCRNKRRQRSHCNTDPMTRLLQMIWTSWDRFCNGIRCSNLNIKVRCIVIDPTTNGGTPGPTYGGTSTTRNGWNGTRGSGSSGRGTLHGGDERSPLRTADEQSDGAYISPIKRDLPKVKREEKEVCDSPEALHWCVRHGHVRLYWY